MSSQNGYVVFTATTEMAKQMPKVFKAGATYVAQRATAVAVGDAPAKSSRQTKTAKKKAAGKPKATKKKVTKKKVTKKTSAKKTSSAKKKKTSAKKTSAKPATEKKATVKSTKRGPIKPDLIIGYVRKNEGCNMTDIEAHTKAPQTAIRRILNSAREDGIIRTEGQRRGLRYFYGSEDSSDALVSSGATSGDTTDD